MWSAGRRTEMGKKFKFMCGRRFNEAKELCRLEIFACMDKKHISKNEIKFEFCSARRERNEENREMKYFLVQRKSSKEKKFLGKLTSFSISLANLTPQQVLLVECSVSHCELRPVDKMVSVVLGLYDSDG